MATVFVPRQHYKPNQWGRLMSFSVNTSVGSTYRTLDDKYGTIPGLAGEIDFRGIAVATSESISAFHDWLEGRSTGDIATWVEEWRCLYCGSPQKIDRTHCTQCGAPRSWILG